MVADPGFLADVSEGTVAVVAKQNTGIRFVFLGTAITGKSAHDQQFKTVASVTDGLANTMAIGEVKCGVSGSTKIGQGLATGWGFTNGGLPAPCLARQQADGTFSGSVSGWDGTMGSRWADSVAVYTHWHVILGPNAPSCGNGVEDFAMRP